MDKDRHVDEKRVPADRQPRDLRYRQQLFPEAEQLVFDVGDKGFVPVPIILRKLFRILSSPEIRVLLYLYLRASRYGICYPSHDEMVLLAADRARSMPWEATPAPWDVRSRPRSAASASLSAAAWAPCLT